MTVNLSMLGGWSLEREVFGWILAHCPVSGHIFELGYGAGSQQLTAAGYQVKSVEHNKDWAMMMAAIFGPHMPCLVPLGEDGWYDIAKVKMAIPDTYDMLIIDGPDTEARCRMVEHLSLFDLTVPIVIDDGSYVLQLVDSIRARCPGRTIETLGSKKTVCIHRGSLT